MAADKLVQLDRVLGQFEEFCVVTQSVRAGIEVDVRVLDRDGRVLRGSAPERATAQHPQHAPSQ